MKVPIQSGQSLQLLVPVGHRTVQCAAVVTEVGNKTFDTGLPQRHGVKIPVEVDHLTATLTMPDAIYTLRCRVVVINKEGMTLAFPPPEEIQRVQRRQFVRVPTLLPCAIEAELKEGEGDFGPPIQGEMQDISGGGCSVMLPVEFGRGTLMRLTTDLPGEGEVILFGRVMRASTQHTRKGVRYSVGLDFGKMEGSLRSRLIRYVFALQREIARKNKMVRGVDP